MTNTLSRGGKRYFITFTNNASKYTYMFFLRIKDEVFEKFKNYKVKVENLLDLKIKFLKSNRGESTWTLNLLSSMKTVESTKRT